MARRLIGTEENMRQFQPPPPEATPDPMGRASKLAEKMAKLLMGEDVSDVAPAVAILTSGVIHRYADDMLDARTLLDAIRKLEDQIILQAFEGKGDVDPVEDLSRKRKLPTDVHELARHGRSGFDFAVLHPAGAQSGSARLDGRSFAQDAVGSGEIFFR
jgi:hypothetical protein